MVPGAFVRVKFPTREKPRQPRLLHIGCVLGGTATEVMVAYTTLQPWPASIPLPAGVRLFDHEEAERLNQCRAFFAPAGCARKTTRDRGLVSRSRVART